MRQSWESEREFPWESARVSERGVAVGVTNGSGVAVGVGVGKGMLDAATAPETGVGVAMLVMAMEPEARLGIGVAVGVGDGNVRRTGVSLVCWGPSRLDEQANEPAIKTTRMEIKRVFSQGFLPFNIGGVLEV